MRYLIGVGDELPPLRFRLLPTWGFVNIEYYEERRQQGLDISRLVATHCGYLKVPPTRVQLLPWLHMRDAGCILEYSGQAGAP